MENFEEHIDANTAAFKEHFGTLSNEELHWKPDSDTWSIAQNIEHLMIINESYFPLLSELREMPIEEIVGDNNTSQVIETGAYILSSVTPDRTHKIKTFPLWEPNSEGLKGDVLHIFSSHQERLKTEIKNSEGLLKRGVVIASPANAAYTYTLATAFEIIVTHEKRHLEQTKEVLEILIQTSLGSK